VPSRARYGTACLLIRYAQLSENGNILCDLSEPYDARGDVSAGNLSTANRDRLFRKLEQSMTNSYCRPL
jgi:hypothetical protein